MAFNITDMTEVGKKEVSLFLGRMQPLHSGHVAIIKKMRNPIVAIVRGVVSSQNKDRNPFNVDNQIKMLKKVFPSVQVIIVPNGYLPEIIDTLRQGNAEVVKVYAGDDRIKEYKSQVERANKSLDEDRKIDVTFEKTDRLTSSSIVRDAIRKGDETTFQKNMPRELWTMWDGFTKILKEQKDLEIKTFSEYLKEDATAVNVSAGVADNPQPLTPLQRRKNLEEDGILDVPNLDKCKGKMRHGMPQIENWDAFVDAVKSKGGDITEKEILPSDLKPSQKNFKPEKVLELIKQENETKPIVTSKDGFVLDGHHRWLASHHDDKKIKCAEISLDLDEVLDLCDGADFIVKKTINENEENI